MIKKALAKLFYLLGHRFDDDMKDDTEYFYEYEGKTYWARMIDDKERYHKVKNPETGEWFDTIEYTEVLFLVNKDDEKDVRYTTCGTKTYYREVEDFKKKFKKCRKSKYKGMKEVY